MLVKHLKGDYQMTQQRSFKMHPQLLFSVIERQAGTLSKAILEGVMNAVDAGATKISVTVSTEQVQISDNGKGFADRREIELFFETFGQPHDEVEQKVYGQFRMGRGQMFAFGANDWRTGEFEMQVDVKCKGLDYRLVEGLALHEGCYIGIDLYEPLLPSDLSATERDIERMVKYVSVPVTLNGKVVSKDPATLKWDHETADAYINLKPSGGLRVYNLGVFVNEMSSYQLGTGGEVVAKQQLKVNFARNDVQSDCPVWKRIKKAVDQRATRENKSKPTLDDGGRKRMADQFRLGELGLEDIAKVKLFTDVTGRHWSLRGLGKWSSWGRKSKVPCTVARDGDALGDKLMQHHIAFVFSEETLERFEVASVPALLNLLRRKESWYVEKWVATPFEKLEKQLGRSYQLVPKDELTAKERALLNTIENAADNIASGLRSEERRKTRTIALGVSACADAWTDGSSYITINRKFLKHVQPTIEGWVRIGSLMLHEYCHDEPNTETHIHTPEFYRRFHDAADLVATFVARAIGWYPHALKKEGLRLQKRDLKDRDKVARAEHEDSKVVEMVARVREQS